MAMFQLLNNQIEPLGMTRMFDAAEHAHAPISKEVIGQFTVAGEAKPCAAFDMLGLNGSEPMPVVERRCRMRP